MKKEIGLIIFVLIVVLGIGLYYSLTKPKEIIDANKILDNPNEYNNRFYLKTLTDEQKNQLLDSFDTLLYVNCKDGKLNGNCTPYFLNSYLRVRANLGELPESAERNVLTSTYLDLKSKYETLTEDDLKAFIVPLLTRFCNIDIYNETERIYWTQKLLDVNKTDWQSTDMQIFYAMICMRANNITNLGEITGMNTKELDNKICNLLPSLKDINTEDLCYVFDYLKIKKFCEINITSEDETIANDLLSKEYESYYQNSCKGNLFKITTTKFISIEEREK